MLVKFALRRPHHVRVIQNRLGLEPVEGGGPEDFVATFDVTDREFQVGDRLGPAEVIEVSSPEA